jgi:hypothetical protein
VPGSLAATFATLKPGLGLSLIELEVWIRMSVLLWILHTEFLVIHSPARDHFASQSAPAWHVIRAGDGAGVGALAGSGSVLHPATTTNTQTTNKRGISTCPDPGL